jgi:hypothetical protein
VTAVVAAVDSILRAAMKYCMRYNKQQLISRNMLLKLTVVHVGRRTAKKCTVPKFVEAALACVGREFRRPLMPFGAKSLGANTTSFKFLKHGKLFVVSSPTSTLYEEGEL